VHFQRWGPCWSWTQLFFSVFSEQKWDGRNLCELERWRVKPVFEMFVSLWMYERETETQEQNKHDECSDTEAHCTATSQGALGQAHLKIATPLKCNLINKRLKSDQRVFLQERHEEEEDGGLTGLMNNTDHRVHCC